MGKLLLRWLLKFGALEQADVGLVCIAAVLA